MPLRLTVPIHDSSIYPYDNLFYRQAFIRKSTVDRALFSPSRPRSTSLLECCPTGSTHPSVSPFKRRLNANEARDEKEKEYKTLKLPAILDIYGAVELLLT
jgi:hypothetical protein